MTVSDTTDISNKNGSRAGAGNYSGMEYGYVNNLYLKNAKVSETGGYGVYVSNTYTGIVRLDVEANQINKTVQQVMMLCRFNHRVVPVEHM